MVLPDRVSEYHKLGQQVYAEARRLAPDHPMVLLLGAGVGLEPEDYWIERERVLKQVEGIVPDWEISYGVHHLVYMGKAREAVELLERAQQLDPLNGTVTLNLAEAYADAEDMKAAFAELDRGRTLANTPRLYIAGSSLLMALAVDDLQAIQTYAEEMYQIDSGGVNAINHEMASLAGDKPALRAALWRAASDPANRTGRTGTLIANWLAYAGDTDLALEVLNSSVDASMFNRAEIWTFSDAYSMYPVLWRPVLREVRKLPGFKDLARQLGLVGYWRKSGYWGDYCRPVGEDDFECE